MARHCSSQLAWVPTPDLVAIKGGGHTVQQVPRDGRRQLQERFDVPHVAERFGRVQEIDRWSSAKQLG